MIPRIFLSALTVSICAGVFVWHSAVAGTTRSQVAALSATGSKNFKARSPDTQRIVQRDQRYIDSVEAGAPRNHLNTSSARPRIWRVRIEPGAGSMLEGSGAAGTLIKVLINGRSIVDTETRSTGRWRVELPSALSPGDHAITVLTESKKTGEAFFGQDIRVSIPVGFSGSAYATPESAEGRALRPANIDDDIRSRAEALADAASRRFAQLMDGESAGSIGRSEDNNESEFVWPESIEEVFAVTRAWLDHSSQAYRNVIVPNLSYPHPTSDLSIPQTADVDTQIGKATRHAPTLFSWLPSLGASDVEPIVTQVQGWLADANRAYQDKIVAALSLPEQTSAEDRAAKPIDEKQPKPAWQEPATQDDTVDLAGAASTPLPSRKTQSAPPVDTEETRRNTERLEIARLEAERLAKQRRANEEKAARAAAERRKLEEDRAAAAKKKVELEAQTKAQAQRKAELERQAKRDATRAAELEAAQKKREAETLKAKEDTERLAREKAEKEKREAERKRLALAKAEEQKKAAERERARLDAERRARQAVEAEAEAAKRRRKAAEAAIVPPTRTKIEVPPVPSRTKVKQTSKPKRTTRIAKLKTESVRGAKRKASSHKKFRKKARKSRKKARKTAVRSYKKRYKKKKKWRSAKRRKCGRRSKKKYYRVRRGDTLWKIAKCYYGKGHLYTAIYRANKKRIRNPNRIWVRQRIRLPKLRRRG